MTTIVIYTNFDLRLELPVVQRTFWLGLRLCFDRR